MNIAASSDLRMKRRKQLKMKPANSNGRVSGLTKVKYVTSATLVLCKLVSQSACNILISALSEFLHLSPVIGLEWNWVCMFRGEHKLWWQTVSDGCDCVCGQILLTLWGHIWLTFLIGTIPCPHVSEEMNASLMSLRVRETVSVWQYEASAVWATQVSGQSLLKDNLLFFYWSFQLLSTHDSWADCSGNPQIQDTWSAQ